MDDEYFVHPTAELTRPRDSANSDLQKLHAKPALALASDLFGVHRR
jgi:hypothetical protein